MASNGIFAFTEFTLSGEHYGLENKYISEVRPLKSYTVIPGTPAHILGIIKSRGKIITIVDLRKYFNLQNRGISELSKVMILIDGTMEFGLVIDTVIGVIQYSLTEVLDPVPLFMGTKKALFKGLTSSRVVLIDGKSLLNDQNLVVNDHT